VKFYRCFFIVVSCIVLLPACPNEQAQQEPARTRVDAVTSDKPKTSAKEWCDVYFETAAAPQLELPAMVPVASEVKPITLPSDRWVWLNLWATWCKPCLRELPLVLGFGRHLQSDGMALDNWFISLDDNPDDVTEYLSRYPEFGKDHSYRVRKPDRIAEWLQRYRLPANTSIPVSMLIMPRGKVRCIRTGSIHEGDYALIKSVLEQL
jgi:thiol-disulfide isomerase/thioredoxin